MAYPKPKKPVILKKKSESWLMRFVGALPVTPDTYMSRFWTTFGHTIYPPTRYDDDEDWGTREWIRRHQLVWDHENIHIVQLERWGLLVPLLYVGPSVYLLVLSLVSLVLPLLLGASWWIPGSLAIATAALSPLSTGLAWGRWRIEREAMLVKMDHAASVGESAMEAQAARISDSLWKNYLYAWPPGWSKKWLISAAKKRATKKS